MSVGVSSKNIAKRICPTICIKDPITETEMMDNVLILRRRIIVIIAKNPPLILSEKLMIVDTGEIKATSRMRITTTIKASFSP